MFLAAQTSSNTASLVLGIVGTVTGVASLVISFLKHWRDRRCFRLTVVSNWDIATDIVGNERTFTLHITVANPSYQAIHILAVGFRYYDPDIVGIGTKSPFRDFAIRSEFRKFKLEAGDSEEFEISSNKLPAFPRATKRLFVYVRDSLGNEKTSSIQPPSHKDIYPMQES